MIQGVKDLTLPYWLCRWRKRPQVEDLGRPAEAKKDKEAESPLESPKEIWSCRHLGLSPVRNSIRLLIFRTARICVVSGTNLWYFLQQQRTLIH